MVVSTWCWLLPSNDKCFAAIIIFGWEESSHTCLTIGTLHPENVLLLENWWHQYWLGRRGCQLQGISGWSNFEQLFFFLFHWLDALSGQPVQHGNSMESVMCQKDNPWRKRGFQTFLKVWWFAKENSFTLKRKGTQECPGGKWTLGGVKIFSWHNNALEREDYLPTVTLHAPHPAAEDAYQTLLFPLRRASTS